MILAAIISGFFNVGGFLNNKEIGNEPPVLTSFEPDIASPQFIETKINWTASAKSPNNDIVFYSFYLKGPSTNNTWEIVQDWRTQNWWLWSPAEPGEYTIEVKVSNGNSNLNSELCDSRDISYSITGWPKTSDAESWNEKSIALKNLGRYEESIAACDEAIKLDPLNAETWNRKAYNLIGIEKYNESLECTSKATELDPLMVSSWINKGVALCNLGRYNESLEALDQAIKLNSSEADAWSNKGVVLMNLERYDESLTCCDTAIKLNPTGAMAYEYKGETLGVLGRYEESLEYHDKATKLNPSYALSWSNKATSLYNLGRYSEAIESYDKALQIDPSNLFYLNYRENAKRALDEQKLNQSSAV